MRFVAWEIKFKTYAIFLSSISMQAQKPVREDDIVTSHKVASVKINHACNDT